MDIRTKLIFALVAVSLGSMFVLGAVVSPRVEEYITQGTLRQLSQVAEARTESIHWIVGGWRERTDLVASRTQLRALLDGYDRSPSPVAVERIRAILADALDASRNSTLLEVFGVDGNSVASARRGSPAPAVTPPVALTGTASGAGLYAGVRLPDGGPPQVTFLAPMPFEGRPIGMLMAVFEAPELVELAASHDLLGETGETLIVMDDGDRGLRTLHPTRDGLGATGAVTLPSDPGSLAVRALAGDTLSLAGGVVDYRGQEVWAAMRPVDETGWGLIVKIDRAEGLGPVVEFNQWLRRTSLILAAFAIVLGLVLALRFALPIHALAEVANRIRRGEMHARANAEREDEVGLLARTFNQMADELEGRMGELHEFRKFFDVTIDLMCIAGTDGYFKKTNPAFERELGWSQEELLERPFYDLVHPDDLASTEQEVAKLAHGIPTISFENRFRCKDGGYKLLRWTSYPEGELLYAIAHVVDTTPAGG